MNIYIDWYRRSKEVLFFDNEKELRKAQKERENKGEKTEGYAGRGVYTLFIFETL